MHSCHKEEELDSMLNEKQIKESANVNPSSSKETFLPYYKEL
jgi:hypothetical protein